MGLYGSMAEGMGSNPGRGTKVLHATPYSQKKKKKSVQEILGMGLFHAFTIQAPYNLSNKKECRGLLHNKS